MALFSFSKKKEKQALEASTEPNIPVEQVLTMRGQGVPNDRIIETLRRAGYSSSQIFGAMSQADTMGAAGPLPHEMEEVASPPPFPSQMPEPPMPPPPQPMEQPLQAMDRETIEEVAESIINEKWEEVVKNINKVIEWKNATETKIIRLEQRFEDMKANFENLHKALIGKVNEFDQNILNVGTEIKAMEKVFQKILPTFTDNVNELSRITGKMKGKK